MREKQPHQGIENQEKEQKTSGWQKVAAFVTAIVIGGGGVAVEQNKENIAESMREHSDEQTLESVNPDQAHSQPAEVGDTFSSLVDETWNGDIDNDGELNRNDKDDGIRPYNVAEARTVSEELYGTDVNLEPHDKVALYEDAPEELE